MTPWAILTGFSFLFFIRLSWRYPVLFPIPTVFWEEGVTTLSSRSVWQRFTSLLKGWKSDHGKMSMWEGALELVALELVYSVTLMTFYWCLPLGVLYCLSGFLRESPNAKDSVCEWKWLWSSVLETMPLWIVLSWDVQVEWPALCSKYHHAFPVPAPQILLQPYVFTLGEHWMWCFSDFSLQV